MLFPVPTKGFVHFVVCIDISLFDYHCYRQKIRSPFRLWSIDYWNIGANCCIHSRHLYPHIESPNSPTLEIITQMQNIVETIPEYKVLRAMNGVGDRLGPAILAEIGDIRRFQSGKALNAFAGNDAPPYQSGQFESRNRHISKRGSSALRKACFEVMQALKLTKPQDDPVYQFILKKEQEGKPCNVAKMAGVNKFLRIYYARAMELYR